MKNLDINETIDLCKQGNTDAFKYIVSEYQQLVYTLAFRILCNETDAEDATQETFIKIWQNIKQYKQQYKFSTWTYKITTHVCYDKLRSQQNITKEELTDFVPFSEENQEDVLHNIDSQRLTSNIMQNIERVNYPNKYHRVLTIISWSSSIAAALLIALFLFEQFLPQNTTKFETSQVLSISNSSIYNMDIYSVENVTFNDFNHFLRVKKERQQTQRRLYSHIINKHLNL